MSTPTLKDLLRSQRRIDGNIAGHPVPEEEEETKSPPAEEEEAPPVVENETEEEEEELPTLEEIKAQYTVPELKELLSEAGVAFRSNAKEDVLAQLYLGHLSAE